MKRQTEFKKNLSALMKGQGFNGKELAAKAKLTNVTISNYMSDNGPTTEAASRIADVFGVSVHWLVLGAGDSVPEDMQDLVNAYAYASPRDKTIIDDILSKYRKE